MNGKYQKANRYGNENNKDCVIREFNEETNIKKININCYS